MKELRDMFISQDHYFTSRLIRKPDLPTTPIIKALVTAAIMASTQSSFAK